MFNVYWCGFDSDIFMHKIKHVSDERGALFDTYYMIYIFGLYLSFKLTKKGGGKKHDLTIE